MGNKKRNHGIRTWPAAFMDTMAMLVDRFGWPGALLLFGVYFVEKHSTSEQKHQIIDAFVLGKGIEGRYPYLIFGMLVVFAAVMFAQQRFWKEAVRCSD
jgi:hypothetical protein